MRRNDGRTPKLRTWIIVERARVNPVAPLSSRSGHPDLPQHWSAKDDADAAARQREWLRFLAEFEGMVNRFDPNW